MPPLRNLLAGSLMLVLASYGGAKAYLYFDAERRVAQALAPLAAIGAVRYDEMSVSLLGQVTLDDLRVVADGGIEPIRIGRLVLNAFSHNGGIFPSRMSLHGEDIRIAAATVDRWLGQRFDQPAQFALPDLSSLGYSQLAGDLVLDWLYSPESGGARLHLAADWPAGGDVSLDLSMDEIRTGAAQGKFRSFVLAYQDKSLAGRLIDAFARREQIEPEIYRQDLLETLRAADPEQPWNIGAANLEQIRGFLEQPGRLTVRMQPYDPIVLDELHHYREGDLPLLFNLQIEAR